MAVTITAGSSGRDYATPILAFGAIPADISAIDDYIIDCYADSEFVHSFDLNFTGKTVGTKTITLRAAAGQSWNDNVNVLSNAYRYNPSNGVALRCTGSGIGVVWNFAQNNLILDGIQFFCDATNGNLIQLFGASGITLKNLIIGSATGTTHSGYFIAERNAAVLTNILCYGYNAAGGIYAGGKWNAGVNTESHSVAVRLSNASGTTHGFFTEGQGHAAKNCIAFGFTKFADVGTGSGGNNCGDDATSGNYPGSSNQTGKVAANQFTSLTAGSEDFRVKTGADLIANGVRDQAFTNDLDAAKTARSLTTPTIGPWEFLAANAPDYVDPLMFGAGL